MTDLRRRLSFGEPPDFPATSGGLATVSASAVRRRRTRAAVTSLTAVALVAAFAAAGGARGGGAAGLQPAGPGPTSPPASPSDTPAPAAGTASPSPAVRLPGPPTYSREPYPTKTPPESTSAPSEPAPDPAPEPAPEPTSTSAPPKDGTEQWRETVETVDDRPELGCYMPAEQNGGWCWRWTGPRSTPARQPVAFVFELCRRAPGTHGDRVDLGWDVELDVLVDYEQDARSADRRAEQPHSRTVALTTCLRWTATWNGIAEDGYWARPGTYHVRLRVLGVLPYVDETGRSTQHGYPGDWGSIELT